MKGGKRKMKYPKALKRKEHKLLYKKLSPSGRKELLAYIKKKKRK